MSVVIITGASDGIGAELARQMAQAQGSALQLVLAARRWDKLESVAQACRQHGAMVAVRPTDVSKEADCRALVADTVARFGGVDTLVNNAGMSGHAWLEEVQDLDWYEDLMRVNLWGSVWCTHAALPHLKASQGRIVAVSSLAGIVALPGRTAYSATKFAMNGFFEALRTEVTPHGVSVTIAYPGVVATDIRSRGYNAQGTPAGQSGLDETDAMPVDVCARLIRQGIEARQREVLMSAKGRLARWLKLVAPGLVDRMALQALRPDARAH